MQFIVIADRVYVLSLIGNSARKLGVLSLAFQSFAWLQWTQRHEPSDRILQSTKPEIRNTQTFEKAKDLIAMVETSVTGFSGRWFERSNAFETSWKHLFS